MNTLRKNLPVLNRQFRSPELSADLERCQSQRPTNFTLIREVATQEARELSLPAMGLLLELAYQHQAGKPLTADDVYDRASTHWAFMHDAVRNGSLEHELHVLDGNWARRLQVVTSDCGVAGLAFRSALGLQEYTAGFNPVAAAPTCGASGVVPGTIAAMGEYYDIPVGAQIEALFVAGVIGRVAFGRGPVSGAQAGCGGEVGVAAGMAAAAATYLKGGDWDAAEAAAGLNMANWTGTDCSPTGGRVEYPCAPRNGFAAHGAVMAAELAMVGAHPPYGVDETLDVIYAVGEQLPTTLRETENGQWAETARRESGRFRGDGAP